MRERIRRLGAAALAAVPRVGAAAALTAATLLTALPASAHDSLVAASPEAGAAVAAPAAVELTFTNPVQEQFAQVAVLGPDETPYHDGEPQVVGATITQPVQPLPAGEVTVSYRIVSADGHPVSGTYTFTVVDSAGQQAAPQPRTDEPASGPTTSPEEADGKPAPRTIVAMLAGAAAISVVLALVTHRRAGRKSGAAADDEST